MNTYKILSVLLIVVAISSCNKDDLKWNLERDNPLDMNQNMRGNIGVSGYTIIANKNNDSIINKGETIKLWVFLKNNGSRQATKVRGTITCSNSYITALSPTTAVGYYEFGTDIWDFINAGEHGRTDTSNYLGFHVSSSTPTGTVITFNIAITHRPQDGLFNKKGSDSFGIRIH